MRMNFVIASVLLCACSTATLAQTKAEIFPQIGHSHPVESIAFAPNGKEVASGSSDHTIKLWDLTSKRLIRTFHGHSGLVDALNFSPDGKTLVSGGGDMPASGSIDHTVVLWDVASGRELRVLGSDSKDIKSVVFSPDGQTVISGSRDGAIKFWNIRSGRLLRTLNGQAGGLFTIALSLDGKTLASAGSDGTIQLWNAITGQTLNLLHGHTGMVFSVAFSPDGTMLASGGGENVVKLWDFSSGRLLRVLQGHERWVTSAAFSPDSRMLASGSADMTVMISDVASGRVLHELGGQGDFFEAVAFSPNGKLVVAGSDDGTVMIWNSVNGQELKTLRGHTDEVESLTFSPDGKVLASGGDDNSIKLWDVASGQLVDTLMGHSGAVTSISFSPDGRLIASGSGDTTIVLWDALTRHALRTIRGHVAPVQGVAFSPNGKTLSSSSLDGTVRLWDVATGRERVSLLRFDGSSIAVTPEGYFDSSSEKAEDNLNVRIGNRVFGISSFRDHFYRPDLVKAAIAGEDLTKFGSIGDVKLSPVVELADLPSSTTSGSLKLNVHLTNGGGGFGHVRPYVNDNFMQEDVSLPASGDALTRSYTVPLLPGENKLSVKAFNADGTMWSEITASVTANLPPPAKVTGAQGTLHAVIVGIQTFPNAPGNDLKYPAADAQLFANTLHKYAAPLFANLDVPPPLTNPSETDKAHIMAALAAMQAKAAPGDTFVVYVAGHGEVYNGGYYLLPSNATARERFATDAISGGELAVFFANKATHKLLVLDTCHAGAMMNQSLADRGMDTGTRATTLGRDLKITVFAAAASDQEAREDSKYQHGLFTYVLANGLSGKALGAQNAATGIVDTVLISNYLDETVPVEAQLQYGRKQQPTTEPGPHPFPITKVR
jgi:WD40 repeat protein